MIELPQRDGTTWSPALWDLKAWKEHYDCDVELELNKMRAWLEANPRRRKIDTKRFVINWLNKAKPVSSYGQNMQASRAYRERVDREFMATRNTQEASPEVAQKAIAELRGLLGMRA